ncbi:histidine phosphotransferase family protein, partial [Paraburkholderia sp. SIMBA_061]
GSAGASIDTGEAEKAAQDFAAAEKKAEVSWNGPRAIVPKNRVKLLLNLFLVAYGAIPRGGNVDVLLENPDGDARFEITVKGRMMRVPAKFVEIYEGRLEEAVDAHS